MMTFKFNKCKAAVSEKKVTSPPGAQRCFFSSAHTAAAQQPGNTRVGLCQPTEEFEISNPPKAAVS